MKSFDSIRFPIDLQQRAVAPICTVLTGFEQRPTTDLLQLDCRFFPLGQAASQAYEFDDSRHEGRNCQTYGNDHIRA